MRQVEAVELEFVLRLAVRKIGVNAVKGLASNQAEVRDRAQRAVSAHLVDAMKRYEIMVDAPEYPGARGDTQVNGKLER